MLTNGVVVVEFEFAEAMPAGRLQDVSASLDTIWTGDEVWDYDNFTTENSPASLTFVRNNDGADVAVLNVTGCGDFVFTATFEDIAEGPITFARDADVAAPCEPTGAAASALEALARANYFAAAYDGVLLWDGPTPVATFADE